MTTAVLLVDAVILFTVLEGIWLWRRGRPAPRDWAWNWASGLCLMGALHAAVAGWGLPWVLLGMMSAGAIHALDLRRRLSRA